MLSGELGSCEWVKIPTTSENCGIAPMKNPECELVVVPVLAMIGRLPSPTPAAVPVPLTVVISIAYWTCEASAALLAALVGSSTPRVCVIGFVCGPSGNCQNLMMCAVWYTPLSAMVD